MDSQLKDAKNIVQEFQEIFTDPVASLWGALEGPWPLQNFGAWSQSSSGRSFTL